jgi:lipopolysaccharide/colanic/teichoic acid biosynthesis glycosyltransferase
LEELSRQRTTAGPLPASHGPGRSATAPPTAPVVRAIPVGPAAPAARTVYESTKRLTDAVGSAALLVVLSPVMLAIAVGIRVDSGLPILYRGQRLGRGGRMITVHKFRTMFDGSHHHLEELLTRDEEYRLEYATNRKLKGDPRRTRVGVLLRRTSLDELPQLWNVLRGDMSLVGPRPYMPGELDAVSNAAELLSVRPGITGLWQVSGRSDLTLEQRIDLETDYVRRRGWKLDVWIALRTLGAVISGRGAY